MKFRTFATLTVCFALHAGAFALGGFNSLGGDEKKVAEALKSQLALSEQDAFRLFDGHLKTFLDAKDWQYNTFNNDSLTNARFGKNAHRVMHINFVTDNRFVNLTITKFDKERQLMIQSVETLPRNSATVLDKYRSVKADTAMEAETDKAEFSSFLTKGKASRVKMLVNSGVGAVQYVDLYLVDLKD